MDVKLKNYKKTVEGNKILFSIEFAEMPKEDDRLKQAIYGDALTRASVATILKMTNTCAGHFVTNPVTIYI
jgi:hypothetical protein